MEQNSFVSSGVRFEIPSDKEIVAGTTPEKELQEQTAIPSAIPMPARQQSNLDVRLQKTCERNGIDPSTFLGIDEKEMLFVTFEHTSAIKVPPIRMGVQTVEWLMPNRMYFCSGAEAKMLATILALHGKTLINATPKRNVLRMEIQHIVDRWAML